MSISRVHLISMGGTISMVSSDSGLVPGLDAQDFLSQFKAKDLTLTSESLPAVPGASITSESLNQALQSARAAVSQGAAGVVITQGTDTLEETSFLAFLVWDLPEPLVLTGAMRPANAPGSDGLGNLSGAIQVAASAGAKDRGALVVFGDEVFNPVYLQKVHSSKSNAFAAPGAGPLGLVGEGKVHWASPTGSDRRAPFQSVASPKSLTSIVVQLDSSPAMVRFALDSPDITGVVIAAMGVGHVPDWWVEPLGELAVRKTVVYCSRTGTGPVFSHSYGFRGSEKDLIHQGLVSAGSLSVHKARLLLAQCQATTPDRVACEELFTQLVDYYSGDSSPH